MKFKPIYVFFILLLGLGVLAFKITSDIRSQSETKLKTESDTAAAMNRQRLYAKKIQDDFEAESRQAQQDREFNRFVYGTSEPPPEVVQQQIERHLRKLSESKDR
jgi:hypothetical protein